MKIKNIEQLRNHILQSLENLADKKIDIDEASIIAKSGETIMSSIKMQLLYASMIGEIPHIDFVHSCHAGSPAIPEDRKSNVRKLPMPR